MQIGDVFRTRLIQLVLWSVNTHRHTLMVAPCSTLELWGPKGHWEWWGGQV